MRAFTAAGIESVPCGSASFAGGEGVPAQGKTVMTIDRTKGTREVFTCPDGLLTLQHLAEAVSGNQPQ